MRQGDLVLRTTSSSDCAITAGADQADRTEHVGSSNQVGLLAELPCPAVTNIVFAVGSSFALGAACQALSETVFFSRFLDAFVSREFIAHLPSIGSAGAGMAGVPAKYLGRAMHVTDWFEVNKAIDSLHYSAHFAHISALKLRAFFAPAGITSGRVLPCVRACLMRVLHRGARLGDGADRDCEAQCWQLTAEVREAAAHAQAVQASLDALRRVLPDTEIFGTWIEWLRRSVLDFQAFPVDDEQFRECLYRLRWFMYWKKCFTMMREDTDEAILELRRVHACAQRCLMGLADLPAGREGASEAGALCQQLAAFLEVASPVAATDVTPEGHGHSCTLALT